MDLKALRDDAQHWSTGGQSHRAAERMAKCVLLLNCPDPLTLDAAKAVMGREPRESCSTLFVWDEESIFVTKNTHEDRVAIVRMWGKDFYLPTIGLFACLVAAARMGEKA